MSRNILQFRSLMGVKFSIPNPRAAVTALALLAASANAGAATRYVDRNHALSNDANPGTAALPWRTVQRGVDASTIGDTVVVKSGDYTEAVTVTKPLNLVGRGMPKMLGAGSAQAFTIRADDVTVEGFHIENYGAGIAPQYFQGLYNRARIRFNYLTRVGYGIWINGDGWLVEGNEINRIRLGGEDYSAIFGTNHIVRRNYFHGTLIPEDLGPGPDYAHNDCLQFWNNNGEVLHNILIEENLFTDFVQGIFIANETGILSSMSNITLRGNVFWGTDFIRDGNLLGWPSHGTFFGKAPIPGVLIEKNLYRNIGNCVSLYAMDAVTAQRNIIVDAGTAYALAEGTLSGALDRGAAGNLLWSNGWNGPLGQGPDRYINPQLLDPNSLLGPDGIPWSADDGWRPTAAAALAYGPQIPASPAWQSEVWAALRDFFRERDLNDDGFLDAAESGLAFGALARMDLSDDGRLSIAELLQASVGPTGLSDTVFVDFDYTGWENGSAAQPFNSLYEAASYVAPGGVVSIAPENTNEAIRISGPMTLISSGTARTR